MSQASAFVSMEVDGVVRLVGRLWTRVRHGRESATFEYDSGWIELEHHFALEPALQVGAGPQHTVRGRAIFAALGDSAPDRWGRTLIARNERLEAGEQGRQPRTLYEIDYLLGVSDFARQGALRFSLQEGGPFVAPGDRARVPPVVELPRLLLASDRVLQQREDAEDLRLILAPGSSLGGARPKASVLGTDGTLMIAKFPAPSEDYEVVRWESVALRLAERAGIQVPRWRLEEVNGRAVLMLQRFDRRGTVRIPYLSAMSMLGALDGETHSYLEIADALRRYGAQPRQDLTELWRRVVFNVLITNTDDHLRNHGFLSRGDAGWGLAPAFDLNPTPIDVKPRVLSTTIGPSDDPSASLDLALEFASHFGLNPDAARAVIGEVARAVESWRDVARQAGLSAAQVDRLSTAFEHAELERARSAG